MRDWEIIPVRKYKVYAPSNIICADEPVMCWEFNTEKEAQDFIKYEAPYIDIDY